MDAARKAGAEWSSLPLITRVKRLARLKREITARRAEILDAVQQDAGKVRTEALLTDLLPTLECLLYNEKNAIRVLSPDRRPGSLLFPGTRGKVVHEPYGTVLVVAPWNNPFQLSILPAASALVAGNAVIIKPSERSSRVAAVLRELFDAAELPAPLVQVVEGGPEVVADIIEAGPDRILFTGGLRGGRAVHRLAAEKTIPVIMELGGKDAMIVFADADLKLAARAAVYGAFAHDGLHCVSVERLYVEAHTFEDFSTQVAEGALRLRRSNDREGDLVAETDAMVAERIQFQIDDALARGARLLTPCRDEKAILPAVLAGVPADAHLMREETFGPVLAIASFTSEGEALHLANDCNFGLNASVWTGDRARAERIASGIESGCVCINNVLVNAGHPALPFGGVKKSGFGRYHGPEGLLAFTRPKAVLQQSWARFGGLNWFPYTSDLAEITDDLICLRYGESGNPLQKIMAWLSLAVKGKARLRKLAANVKKMETHN